GCSKGTGTANQIRQRINNVKDRQRIGIPLPNRWRFIVRCIMAGNRNRMKWLTILLFLLPSCAGLLLFSLIPIAYSFVISLTDWNGLNRSNLAEGIPSFVGFGNYSEILGGSEFWRVLGNTVYFIVLYIPLILIFSIIVAVLLNQAYRGISVYRVLF